MVAIITRIRLLGLVHLGLRVSDADLAQKVTLSTAAAGHSQLTS